MKNFYSPSMLKSYLSCKYIIFNDIYEKKLKLKKIELSKNDKLRLEKGNDHEKNYLKELKKKYKKVLQNKTYQNDQGYFVTKSEYVEVTDDEAEDEDEAPKKMMNLKRKSPSVTKKKNFSSSNGGKAKKKQKSLMGFFSKRK